VPHQRLFLKLSHYGIQGALPWMKDFFDKPQVVLNNTASEPVDLLSGIPQGSVFLLLLLYVTESTKTGLIAYRQVLRKAGFNYSKCCSLPMV